MRNFCGVCGLISVSNAILCFYDVAGKTQQPENLILGRVPVVQWGLGPWSSFLVPAGSVGCSRPQLGIAAELNRSQCIKMRQSIHATQSIVATSSCPRTGDGGLGYEASADQMSTFGLVSCSGLYQPEARQRTVFFVNRREAADQTWRPKVPLDTSHLPSC